MRADVHAHDMRLNVTLERAGRLEWIVAEDARGQERTSSAPERRDLSMAIFESLNSAIKADASASVNCSVSCPNGAMEKARKRKC